LVFVLWNPRSQVIPTGFLVPMGLDISSGETILVSSDSPSCCHMSGLSVLGFQHLFLCDKKKQLL
jgi:hypothetical protein